MRTRLPAAAFLAAALLAMPAAADPTITSVPLTASGTTYNEATYNDGTHFFADMLMGGWTGSAWKPLTVDPTTGYLGVNVFSSVLPTGAATAGAQATENGSLATIAAATGNPTDPKSTATDSTSASETALLKGQIDRLQAIVTALGSPLQAGGSVAVSGSTLPAGAATSALQQTIAANTTPAGVGAMASVPAASTNGTALGALPAAGKGARFYLGASDSVTFTVATAAPGAAPTVTYTISGASGGTGPNWDENLSGGAMVYVTATTGSPKFRWF